MPAFCFRTSARSLFPVFNVSASSSFARASSSSNSRTLRRDAEFSMSRAFNLWFNFSRVAGISAIGNQLIMYPVCSIIKAKLTCWNPSHAFVFSQPAKLSRFGRCVKQIGQARDIAQCSVASYRSAYRSRLGMFGSKGSEPVFRSTCRLKSSSRTEIRSHIPLPTLAKRSIAFRSLFILRGVCRSPAWVSWPWLGSLTDFGLPFTRRRTWERCGAGKSKRKIKRVGPQGSRRPSGRKRRRGPAWKFLGEKVNDVSM